MSNETKVRKTPSQVADALMALYGEAFGGKDGGRFRISRKFLRQLAGRRKLHDGFVSEVAEELFELGFVFIDLETHFAVLEPRIFNSYRRVTAAAVDSINRGSTTPPADPPRLASENTGRGPGARVGAPKGET